MGLYFYPFYFGVFALAGLSCGLAQSYFFRRQVQWPISWVWAVVG